MSLSRSHRLTCSTRRASGGTISPPSIRADVAPDDARASRRAAERDAAVVDRWSDEARACGGPPRHRRRRDVAFLAREGVERRRDDPGPVAVDPRPARRLAREKIERVGLLDVAGGGRPSRVGQPVRRVAADVTAPDDVRPGGTQPGDQPAVCGSCSRTMSPARTSRRRCVEVVRQRPTRRARARRRRGSRRPRLTVQQVVDPLGEREERPGSRRAPATGCRHRHHARRPAAPAASPRRHRPWPSH